MPSWFHFLQVSLFSHMELSVGIKKLIFAIIPSVSMARPVTYDPDVYQQRHPKAST
jgi:hypothetical protein